MLKTNDAGRRAKLCDRCVAGPMVGNVPGALYCSSLVCSTNFILVGCHLWSFLWLAFLWLCVVLYCTVSYRCLLVTFRCLSCSFFVSAYDNSVVSGCFLIPPGSSPVAAPQNPRQVRSAAA